MKSLISFFFIIFLTVSCRKDEIVFIPDQTYTINSDELLSKLIETPDTYQILLKNSRNIFITPGNIIIDIPEQSLVDESGNIVSGDIKLQFKEFTNKKSNLLFTPSTIFENKILDCSKIFFIKFSQNGKELHPVKPIDIYLPSQDFKANYQAYSAIRSDNILVWKKMSSSSENVRNEAWNLSYEDAQWNVNGFKISISGTSNWFCIASQSDQFNKEINVCLNTSLPFSKNNSLVYLVCNTSTSCIKLVSEGNFSSFSIQNISLNQKLDAKIIIISHLGNEDYYFGMTNAVSDSNVNVTIKPERKNIKDIKEVLNTL